MKIYSAERGAGKTTALVEESAKTGAIIVVASYPMVNYTMGLAMRLNLDIPEPITVTNYLKVLVHGGLNREQKYLVDDLQMMLSQMNVETATVDVNYVEPIARGERDRRAILSVVDDFNALGNIRAVSSEEIREAKSEFYKKAKREFYKKAEREFYKKANEKLGFLNSVDDC